MVNSPEKQYQTAQGLSEADKPHRGSKSPKSEKWTERGDDLLLKSMVRNVDSSARYWDRVYQRARKDIDFAYYEQWPQDARMQRENLSRPVLQPNIIPQYINRIAGAMRQTKFSMHVQQVGGPSGVGITEMGTKIPFSEVMEGLIRDIEAKSHAHMAYSRAGQHAVEGSIGWLRVKLITSPLDPFNAEVRIQHLKDRFSVVMDHLAEMPNLQDSNYGFIGRWMNIDDFKEKWPHTVEGGQSGSLQDFGVSTQTSRWYNKDDSIMVGEYYWKEPVRRKKIRLIDTESGRELVLDHDENKAILDELQLSGFRKTAETEIDDYDVKVILCTAKHVLEGPFLWPGKTIPIVPVVGRQVDLGDDTDYQAIHRNSFDSQIMFNYMSSAAIERVADAPSSPWLVALQSMKGVDNIWDDANVTHRKVMPYKHEDNVPPPQRIPGAEVPQAEIALTQLFQHNLMQGIGLYEANLGAKSNETSGVAIQQRQMAGEYGATEFIDNLAYAIETLGDICCEILPKVYSNTKMRRLVMADNAQVDIILNKVAIDEETQTEHTINNIGLARFASKSTAGPSMTSQRSEVVHFLTELSKANPAVLNIMPDLLVKYMDMPGGSIMERRLRHLVPRHLLSPEEQEDMPPPEPTPAEQVEMMKAESDGIKAQSGIEIAKLQVEQQQVRLEQEEVRLEREKHEFAEGEMAADREREAEESKESQVDDESLEKKITAIAKKVLAQSRAEDKVRESQAKGSSR